MSAALAALNLVVAPSDVGTKVLRGVQAPREADLCLTALP